MQNFSRLLDKFSPTNYNLSLHLDRKERVFGGTVTITGQLLAADYLPLHAKDLTIESAMINNQPAEVSHHEHDELHLTQANLTPGEVTVTLQFTGQITDAMNGLYPCYYQYDGIKKELLATQFESHHAREAFPCVDEPAAKATFDLSLSTEDDVQVLSNMPIKHQRPGSDTTPMVTIFETTPKMSTYLLAWVVGDLQKKTAYTKTGVEVNVWATPAQPAESLDFALDIATRCIDFYNEYFGTSYPLTKCDHVALPDFSSGAMENWGLITYREIALLASKNSSIDTRRYIATVICHELAHQWFGNLVTMKWWDDLWLNESFATMMEYLAVDALEPDWNIWRDFASNETVIALRRDSLDGVQPVHLTVNHPDEIGTLFDGAIVYAKGANLLHMVQSYIGDDDFRAGLQQYFKDFAYKNTVGLDLWAALERASGKNITNMMQTWVSQPGFPVVNIATNEAGIELTQEQFFIGPHKPSEQIWPIPLASSSQDVPAILDKKSVHVKTFKPFFINQENVSYFIANYPAEFVAKRLKQITEQKASEITRLQFLHEQSLLAKAGMISLADILPILMAYKNEQNEAVWGIISLVISELRRTIEGIDEAENNLRKFVRELITVQYKRLGWQARADEPDNDAVLRGIIISLALYSEDKVAIITAKDIYKSNTLANINPELRTSIIASHVRHGNADITKLLSIYASEQDSEIKNDLASSISSVRSNDGASQILKALQDSNIVRPQDVFRWFAYLIRNYHIRAQVWQWTQDNWDWIESTFSSDKSLDNFPRYAANALATQPELDSFTTFFTPHLSNPGLNRAITIGKGEIKGRIEQIKRDRPNLIDKLRIDTV